MKELSGQWIVNLRSTGGASPPYGANLWCGAVEANVLRNEQVQLSITIDVRECRAQTPVQACNSALRRHIFELAVSFVMIKCKAMIAGQEDIGPAVAIVIAHGASHPIPIFAHTALGRHVFEPTVSGVVEQGKIIGPDKQNVRPAVAVIIDESASAACRLQDCEGGATAMSQPEINSG